MSQQRIATSCCTDASSDGVVEELAGSVRDTLGSGPVDLAILFGSPHFRMRMEQFAMEVYEALAPRALLGTLGETVIHDERELEGEAGIVLWAARLPGAHVRTFHLSHADQLRLAEPDALREHLHVPADAGASFVLTGDPYSIDVLALLETWERAYPQRPIVGGMASAAQRPGQNAVVFDGQCVWHGMVGAALWGDVHMDTVVSQGCRPIGKHMVVTRAHEHMIHTLGGRKARDVFEQIFQTCTPRDRELLQAQGLFLGRVINEYQQAFARGDFLIRNVLGFDRDSGAVAVHDHVRTGQTVQFHVRDAQTADEDLQSLLAARGTSRPTGALLFTCNGRGRRMFETPHHDARAVAHAHAGLPVAGFFCAGEIGPVGRRNFLHGHTASIGLVGPARASADD